MSDETILVPPPGPRGVPAEARLEDWYAVYASGDGYMTPEMRGLSLCGTVTGHPSKPDGSKVTTSPVVRATGGLAVTATGTRYRLGRPRGSYRAWSEENDGPWDEANPLRVGPQPAAPEAAAPPPGGEGGLPPEGLAG